MSKVRYIWLLVLALILLAITWKLGFLETWADFGPIVAATLMATLVFKALRSPTLSRRVKFLLIVTLPLGFLLWVFFTFLFRRWGIDPSWALAFPTAYPVALLIAEVLGRKRGYPLPPAL